MVIFFQRRDGTRGHYRVASVSDFFPILEKYPALTSSVVMAQTVREAAEMVADYMNRHHVNAWIEGDEMQKSSLGTAAAAVGIGAAALGVGQPEPKDIHAQQKPAVITQQAAEPFGNRKEDAFLWNIKQIESSNGTNTNHQVMQSGIHRGQSAVGKWALMPKTILDLAARLKKLGRSNEEIDHLSTLQPAAMKAYLESRPDVELGLARFMARHLLQRHRGDERRAAYSWLHGHNLHSTDISEEDLGHDYVKRYASFDTKNPLRPRKPSRSIASVSKSEQKIPSVDQFTKDIQQWLKMREDYNSRPLPDGNFVPDPGRQRDDSKYEKPSSAQVVRDYVRSRK